MPIEIRAWKFAVPLVGTLFLAAACSSSNPTADIPTPTPTPTPTLASELSEFFAGPSTPGADDNAAQHIARATATAAGTAPVGTGTMGGVSQGGGVTAPVNWEVNTVEGVQTRTVTIAGTGSTSFTINTGTDENLEEDTGTYIRTFTQRVETETEGETAGTLYVSGRGSLGGDNDFLVHGFWLYDPVGTEAADVPLIGAFVDAVAAGDGSPLTVGNLDVLAGNAIYSGEAIGLYHEEAGDTSTNAAWRAVASLTATFGDTDMIEGTIDTFTGLPEEVASPTVTLEAAPFSTTLEGGFFTGATRAMVEIGDADAVPYTGNWGGKFYVTDEDTTFFDPAWVAGTFGFRSPTTDTDATRAFLGTFGAQRGDSPPPFRYDLRTFFAGPSTPGASDDDAQNIAHQTALAADRTPRGDDGTGGVSQGAGVAAGAGVTVPVDWVPTPAPASGGAETFSVTITEGSNVFTIDTTTDAAGSGANANLVQEGNEDIVAFTQRRGPAATPTGTLYVWASDGGTEEFGDDDDYLTYGFWLHDPVGTDAEDLPSIGAFVDSNAVVPVASLAPLTGTAVYSGGAVGLYHEVVVADQTSTYADWEADAALTADFGTNMISGTINQFIGLPDGVESPTVLLQDAAIDTTTVEGGFFNGLTETMVTIDNTAAAYAGVWGGKFYVDVDSTPAVPATDHPDWVAGTFGFDNTDASVVTRAFLGAFAAQLDDE